MEEIWRDVPDYEGLYQVSSFGNVKNVKFNRPIKQSLKGIGYIGVVLSKCNKRETFGTHQLVAMAFLNHKRNGHNLVVDHINDDKTDNRVENLQIVTQRYNSFKTQSKYSSQYKGVSWSKQSKKWVAHMYINNKKMYLGLYENEYNAHLAYQNALNNLEQ